MSRILFFCTQIVKNFTSKLHKYPPRNLLKFMQFATCFLSPYLLYSYQEVREMNVVQDVMCRYSVARKCKRLYSPPLYRNKRKELIQWQSTNGGIIF
nr:MAG TPA: hypothetical protein [Caudoviricetes sp.]